MKAISLILLLAIAAGLAQWRQLSTLRAREVALEGEVKALRLEISRPSGSANGSAPGASGTSPSVPALDVAGMLALIRSMLGPDGHGDHDGNVSDSELLLFEALTAATTAQLQELAGEITAGEFPDYVKHGLHSMIIARLAHRDPRLAAEFTLAAKEREPFASAMQSWLKRNPLAAAEWLESALAGGQLDQNTFAESIYGGEEGMARLRSLTVIGRLRLDPAGPAFDRLATMDPALADDVIKEVLRDLPLAQMGPFLSRLATEKAPPPRALREFGRRLAESADPATARGLMDSAGLTPSQFDEIAAHFATSDMGPMTPERAAWFLKTARGPARDEHFRSLITHWTEADYNSAATWLRALPASADRDFAVSVFAPLVAKKEPPSAVDWAATISAAPQRDATLRTLWQDWHATAPAEADAYFQSKAIALPQ